MDNVYCNGNEESFLECTYITDENCGPGEGAGVVCSDTQVDSASPGYVENFIWLEGGSGPHEGNLMVQLPNGRTGPVCDDTFNDEFEDDLEKVSYFNLSE